MKKQVRAIAVLGDVLLLSACNSNTNKDNMDNKPATEMNHNKMMNDDKMMNDKAVNDDKTMNDNKMMEDSK